MSSDFPILLLKQCWFLAGPTACGKTATALALVRRAARLPNPVRVEIVALDSMSLYRGMDIGTAKPSATEQSAVPHHLIDIADPADDFSTADYVTAARAACEEIVARGGTPLFVGGTGLYLRSILRGVFDGPSADWDFRRALEAVAAEQGPSVLHERLRAVDPVSADRLHPNDQVRVTRALEVHRLTGKPLSAQQQQPPLPEPDRPDNVFWLSPPREWLYERINHRVEQMIAEGLIDEVRRLMAAHRPLGRTASQGLGYKEVIDHLAGNCTLEECVATIQTRTRQFAKRQHTWFRNLEECRPIEVDGTESADDIATKILQIANLTGDNGNNFEQPPV